MRAELTRDFVSKVRPDPTNAEAANLILRRKAEAEGRRRQKGQALHLTLPCPPIMSNPSFFLLWRPTHRSVMNSEMCAEVTRDLVSSVRPDPAYGDLVSSIRPDPAYASTPPMRPLQGFVRAHRHHISHSNLLGLLSRTHNCVAGRCKA